MVERKKTKEKILALKKKKKWKSEMRNMSDNDREK